MRRLRRASFVDELIVGDTSAVMVDDEVIVLSVLATSLLAHVRSEDISDITTLTAALVEAFGEPPDGTDSTDVVTTLVDDLIRRGVLVHVDSVEPGRNPLPDAE